MFLLNKKHPLPLWARAESIFEWIQLRWQGTGENTSACWKEREWAFAENFQCAQNGEVSSEFRRQKAYTQVSMWALWPWASHWIFWASLFCKMWIWWVDYKYGPNSPSSLIPVPLPGKRFSPTIERQSLTLYAVNSVDSLWLRQKPQWQGARLEASVLCSLLCFCLCLRTSLGWPAGRRAGMLGRTEASQLIIRRDLRAHSLATHSFPEVSRKEAQPKSP